MKSTFTNAILLLFIILTFRIVTDALFLKKLFVKSLLRIRLLLLGLNYKLEKKRKIPTHTWKKTTNIDITK